MTYFWSGTLYQFGGFFILPFALLVLRPNARGAPPRPSTREAMAKSTSVPLAGLGVPLFLSGMLLTDFKRMLREYRQSKSVIRCGPVFTRALNLPKNHPPLTRCGAVRRRYPSRSSPARR